MEARKTQHPFHVHSDSLQAGRAFGTVLTHFLPFRRKTTLRAFGISQDHIGTFYIIIIIIIILFCFVCLTRNGTSFNADLKVTDPSEEHDS